MEEKSLEEGTESEIVEKGTDEESFNDETEDVRKIIIQSDESASEQCKHRNKFDEIHVFRRDEVTEVDPNEKIHPVFDGEGVLG